MLEALGFFAVVEAAGLAAVPLAALVLGRLPGAGLGFAKPLGMLLVGWLAWMAASLGVAPYGRGTILAAFAVVALGGLLAARALPREDPARRELLVGAEAVFAVAFAAMALLTAYAPDVWNTEKPMDVAITTAIGASRGFPPHDPWMSGEPLNYYYLGHLLLGMPGEVLGLEPSRAYNLALAALFGLCAAAVFALAGTAWAAARERAGMRGGAVGAGLAAVVLCLVLGNLAGAREWLDAAHPPGDYDWFGASRVIPDTINEIPSFSFTLGDLHAHVLAVPFTFLALAFALQVLLGGPRLDRDWRATAEALATGLAVGVLYAINAWSYPVVAGLLLLAVLARWRAEPDGAIGYTIAWSLLVVLASVVLLLPFWLHFDPSARGVGAVTTHRSFTQWAGEGALIYAVLGWGVLTAYAGRLRTARRPLRTAVWIAVGGVFVLSALAPLDLSGIAALLAALGVALHALFSRRIEASERFLWLAVAGGVACALLPELVYVRDEFDHSELYRMNTVFKLGYQAYLLLAVAAAVALPSAARRLPRRAWAGWAAVAAVLLLLGLVFPYAGNFARRDGFSHSPTLDGLGWLRERAPGDVAAIAWLRAHAPGDAVVLEAVGPDYSAFGHARISSFSGRSAVMGWQGHEVQWAHDPGGRAQDVKALYTATDPAAARPLLARYGVDYVVAGPIERADYGDAGLAKWDRLGRRVLDQGGTTVWDVTAA